MQNLLGNRYRIVGTLVVGEDLARDMALKLLDRILAKDEEFVRVRGEKASLTGPIRSTG